MEGVKEKAKDSATPSSHTKSLGRRKLILKNRKSDAAKKSVPEGECTTRMVLRPRLKKHVSNDHAEDKKSTKHTDKSPEICKCPECGRAFTDKKRLQNHRKIGHRVPLESLLESPDTSNCSNDDDGTNSARVCEGSANIMGNDIGTPQTQDHISQMSQSVLRLIQDCEVFREENSGNASREALPPTPSSSSGSDNSISNSEHLSSEQQPSSSNVMPPPQPLPARHVQFNTPGNPIQNVQPGFLFPVIQHECPLCKLVFPTKGAYKNHLECHEGLRPFPCPVCYFSYVTEIQLLEHFSSKHSKEPFFKCGGCGKSYRTMRGMNNHKILKHCRTPGSSSAST